MQRVGRRGEGGPRDRKRVGVLGTFVWDTIHRPGADGPPVEQLGGIAYSLAAFTVAAPPGWEVVPLVRVGSDLAAAATAFVSALPGVITPAGLRIVPEPGNRVELRYTNESDRTERLTGGVPGWPARELRAAVHELDALYVNFIAGNEIDLLGARWLAWAFRGPLYADLHSLFLGDPPPAGPRPPRRLPSAARWLACFDAVQLNRAELALLNEQSEEERAFTRRLVARRPGVVFVTRGGEGAWVATGRGDDSGRPWQGPEGAGAAVHDLPVIGGARAGDPTGCGDVWGSVAFAGLLAGLGPLAAAERAHRAAAARLEARSIDELAACVERALHE